MGSGTSSLEDCRILQICNRSKQQPMDLKDILENKAMLDKLIQIVKQAEPGISKKLKDPSHGVLLIDKRENVVWMNTIFEIQIGLTLEASIGKNLGSLKNAAEKMYSCQTELEILHAGLLQFNQLGKRISYLNIPSFLFELSLEKGTTSARSIDLVQQRVGREVKKTIEVYPLRFQSNEEEPNYFLVLYKNGQIQKSTSPKLPPLCKKVRYIIETIVSLFFVTLC
jgi:hypothetical protein